jgi:hypothetical protein
MSLYDGELAGVYPEENEDRHAVQMAESDYEDDESDQSVSVAALLTQLSNPLASWEVEK